MEINNRIRHTNEIESLALKIREFYSHETGSEYPLSLISQTITQWVEIHLDTIVEDLEEILTAPGRPQAQDFRRQLEIAVQPAPILAVKPVEEIAEASIFTGNRKLSLEKLSAMTAYISWKGKNIYKTKLNKLLFYSDFVNYYISGQSISGATYVHLPYGPVPDGYETLLQNISDAGTIEIVKGQTFELIRNGNEPSKDALDVNERETLDWVLDTFGHLSAAQISELSHSEKAYRFTRPGEPIAYEYAKFFEKLPTIENG